MAKKSPRIEMLETAMGLTGGDRDVEYGDPMVNLRHNAELWSTYLVQKYSLDHLTITEEDVAHMMVLLKVARTFSGNVKRDTYVDAAAYAAIAGEMAERANAAT